jgi:hypothetical protein
LYGFNIDDDFGLGGRIDFFSANLFSFFVEFSGKGSVQAVVSERGVGGFGLFVFGAASNHQVRG